MSKDEVAERINRAAGLAWWPFASGMRGGVYLDRVRLSYVETWLFDYNAHPIFAGKLESNFGSCEIDAKFRAPVRAYVFFAFWYLVLGEIIVGLILSYFRGSGPDLEPALLFPTLFLLAPLGMHYVFTRNSDTDLQTVLDWLESEAALKRV